MSSGLSTLFKILGAAVVVAAIVLAVVALVSTFFPDTITWFKGKIGMSMLYVPKMTVNYMAALWG